MTDYVVLGFETSSYVNKAGESINKNYLYYFNMADLDNSRLEKGYILLRRDVYPDFSASDFPELPGVYDLLFRPVRGRDGKPEPKLISIVGFKHSVKIPPNGSYYLVLGARRYEFKDVSGKVVTGIKFFVVDPSGYQDTDKFSGLPLLEPVLDKVSFDQFPKVPGYYDLDMREIRGKFGNSLYKILSAQFQSAFTLSSNSSLQSVGA